MCSSDLTPPPTRAAALNSTNSSLLHPPTKTTSPTHQEDVGEPASTSTHAAPPRPPGPTHHEDVGISLEALPKRVLAPSEAEVQQQAVGEDVERLGQPRRAAAASHQLLRRLPATAAACSHASRVREGVPVLIHCQQREQASQPKGGGCCCCCSPTTRHPVSPRWVGPCPAQLPTRHPAPPEPTLSKELCSGTRRLDSPMSDSLATPPSVSSTLWGLRSLHGVWAGVGGGL